MNITFALIHSPLVGPSTWIPVAEELARRGIPTVIPTLHGEARAEVPYWKRQAESASPPLRSLPPSEAVVLVAHSGAGALLPAIHATSRAQIAHYIFVDAGLPHPRMSRLADMERSSPEFASSLRSHLEEGGRFPEWSDEDLREIIPNDHLRRTVLAELRPHTLAFFEEPMPDFPDVPDTPCAYLKLSEAYAGPCQEAKLKQWPVSELAGGHFHMLVDPETIADVLVGLTKEM